jgi:hypothetical protein
MHDAVLRIRMFIPGIPDLKFSIQDPESGIYKIPDPDPNKRI